MFGHEGHFADQNFGLVDVRIDVKARGGCVTHIGQFGHSEFAGNFDTGKS